MREIRRADPAARRRLVFLAILGTAVGVLSLSGFDRYREALWQWLVSEPGEVGERARLVVLLGATILSAPLVTFAAFLWWVGTEVLVKREFPLPGQKVIRDTPVIQGTAALMRGHRLKALAMGLGLASAMMWLLLWRFADTLGG